jgi:poly(A) polymerase
VAAKKPDQTISLSLGREPWLNRAETQTVFAALERDGHQARAVGGAVRNALMGVPVHEVDIATTALPQDVILFAREAGLAAHPTGLDHGTVTLVTKGITFEVTTLRRDVETDGRHAKVAFTDDWAEDARRRDFTINALYCDARGDVFDPLGGYPDVQARRVRFIADARERIREDFLRILRFFRFTAAYATGDIDPEGLAACIAEKDGLATLSAERVRAELLKLLGAAHARDVVGVMAEHSFMEDVLGFPPDLATFGSLVAIEAGLSREPDAVLRLAALMPEAESEVSALQTRLRLSGAERDRLRCAITDISLVRAATDEADTKVALYKLGKTDFTDATLLAWARSGDGPDNRPWQARLAVADHWQPPEMPVRGSDILALGVPAGPEVGRILDELERWWIGAGFPEDRELIGAKLRALIGG